VRYLLGGVDRVVTGVAGLVTALLMLVTTLDAALRYLFNHPLPGGVEITGDYAVPLIIFLSATHAYRGGAFVRITLLVGRLPAGAQLVANYIAQGLSAAIGLLLTVATLEQVWRAYEERNTSNGTFEYPLWPAYALALIGLALMTAFLVMDLRRVRSGESGLLRNTPVI